jgi:hypothetical protein
MPDMRGFVIGVIELAVLMTVFFCLGAADWVGGANEPNAYCERVRTDRMIRQPVNTASNIAPIIIGLNILLAVAMSGRPVAGTPPLPNPMAQSTAFSILYGCMTIWLGPGSMFLHASQKQWGAWLDNLCMDMYIGLILAYDAYRCFRLATWAFFTLYAILVAITAVFTLVFNSWPYAGIFCFAVLIALTVILDASALIFGRFSRSLWWLLPAALTFFGALAIWQVSKTGGPWCNPDSIWQGHAAWHILTAFTTLFLFLYLRSES